MTTLLNGQITVDSTPNELTTFTVTLPEPPLTKQEAPQEVYENTALSMNDEPVELEKNGYGIRCFQRNHHDHRR